MRKWLWNGYLNGVRVLMTIMVAGPAALSVFISVLLFCDWLEVSKRICFLAALTSTALVGVAALGWALRRVFGMSLRETAFAGLQRYRRDIIYGFLVGVVGLSAVAVWHPVRAIYLHAPTLKQFVRWNWPSAVLVSLAGVPIAVAWEAAARGVVFAGINRSWGFWPAAVASSSGIWLLAVMFFPSGHMSQDPLSALAGSCVWWAMSVTFCWLYWRSGSLWLPIGVRYAWVVGAACWGMAVFSLDSAMSLVFWALPGPLNLKAPAVFCIAAIAASWVLLRCRAPSRPWRVIDKTEATPASPLSETSLD